MLSKNINNVFNKQLKAEFYASHLYLSMSVYCRSKNLSGFAHWMQRQSEEERSHAMRLMDYIQDRDGQVILPAIEQPPAKFKSPVEMFKQVVKHERSVTEMIHKSYKQAAKESDHATEVELQWFIKEQVEEEKTARDMVVRLEMVGDDPAALLMVDHHLASR